MTNLPMKNLPMNLFWNLDRYPAFTFRADQWGEYGWVYDPHTDRYIAYEIDRKEQYDRVSQVATRAELIDKVLPKAEKKLRDWFASFTVARTETDVYILTTRGSIRRYPLGELPRDAYDRPQQEVVAMEAAELPGAVRKALGIAE
ncbi:MAG: hypothetical protein ACI8RZ_003002 [Myxococcota bacterium]|jgi:hypothetical protein